MLIPDDTLQQWTSVLEQRIRHAVTEGRSVQAAVAHIEVQEQADWSHNPDLLTSRLQALAIARDRYLEKLNRVSYLQKSAMSVSWFRTSAETCTT